MIIENLDFALSCAGIMHKSHEIEKEYDKIQTIDDVIACDKLMNNLLWNWLPAIVYEKFGLDFYLSNFCNVPTDQCYIMLHPYYATQKDRLREAIKSVGTEIFETRLCFSLSNAAKIYGGFPWFGPYVKLCRELNCFDKIASVFCVRSSNGAMSADMIERVRRWKNECRDAFAPAIKKNYAGEQFPGIINAFHSPTYIEYKRFAVLLNDRNT